MLENKLQHRLPTLLLMLAIAVLSIGSGCKKKVPDVYTVPGKTKAKGPVTLYVHCVHHTYEVAGLKVYYKIDATAYPGSDVTQYDYSTTTDAHGYAKFDSLLLGSGYLYATGFDPTVNKTVVGNSPTNFTKQNVSSDYEADATLYVSE